MACYNVKSLKTHQVMQLGPVSTLLDAQQHKAVMTLRPDLGGVLAELSGPRKKVVLVPFGIISHIEFADFEQASPPAEKFGVPKK